MKQKDIADRRTDVRLRFYHECFIQNKFVDIKSQTVDVSKIGVGVLVINGTSPFKKGDKVLVNCRQRFSLAQVRWTKRDVNNNTTRMGLKLSTGLFF